MNGRLLEWLRCPDCGERVEQRTADTLHCRGCAHAFEVRGGAPRFCSGSTRTAAYFGYGWGVHTASVTPPQSPAPWHLRTMQDAVGAPSFDGLIVDAGCGDGTDLALLSLDPRCEVVGVELSTGGVATSLRRTDGLERAHVVQADLLNLPLASGRFDGAYSYGVVHHTPDPSRAVREIARTLKPGASLLLYVYEDFSDRSPGWRVALRAVNLARVITTHLPAPLLLAICRALSPIVYVLLTVPSRRFRWAARFPYRHNTNAWDLGEDLYDRFAAPIEKRYSERTAAALVRDAGLEVVKTAQCRGWIVWGRKPVTP